MFYTLSILKDHYLLTELCLDVAYKNRLSMSFACVMFVFILETHLTSCLWIRSKIQHHDVNSDYFSQNYQDLIILIYLYFQKFSQHPKIEERLCEPLLKEIQRVSPSYNVDKMYKLLKEKKEDQDAEMTNGIVYCLILRYVIVVCSNNIQL